MNNQPDIEFMRQALKLAEYGEGLTRPNPPVGAVVVAGGKVIGKGWHKKPGSAHAEILAIKSAGAENCRGATIYVTLEPCSTYGRTPPCTEAIISAGFKRVVIALSDPNPRHAGRGIMILRKAGIAVDVNVEREAAERILAPFAKWIIHKRPFVSLKMGMTVDGRIADAGGKSQWITGVHARKRVQLLRKRADVVMVGVGTVIADNPSLLCRLRKKPAALRVIVDTNGKTPLKSKVLTDGFSDKTIIATTDKCPVSKLNLFRKTGADVWVLPASEGKVSLKSLMVRLGKSGIMNVLCDGGGVLAESLVKSDLVDEYLFFIAPKLLGGMAVPVFNGRGWRLSNAANLKFTDMERTGEDIFIRAVKGD